MNIVVLFGAKSVEHEISIISAFQVIETLKIKYNVIPVYVSKNNEFFYDKKMSSVEYFKNNKKILKSKNRIKFKKKKDAFYICGKKKRKFDVIFPVVHGKGAEDGTILDYFKFQGIPIVGNNSSFYAMSQNKYLTKILLNGLNINNAKYRVIKRGDDYKKEDFKFPLIVKPNNLGSSLGISIVNSFIELERAISLVYRIDDVAIVEEYLERAIEYNISVLNNNGVIEVSNIERIEKGEIFTFEDKYLSNNKKCGLVSKNKKINKGKINNELKKEIEDSAKLIYKEFGASGVIRIDYLYKDKLYVNEINAIPGSYAHYLWEDKYDFLELLDIVFKEAKRDNFFFLKKNELIDRNLIFNIK